MAQECCGAPGQSRQRVILGNRLPGPRGCGVRNHPPARPRRSCVAWETDATSDCALGGASWCGELSTQCRRTAACRKQHRTSLDCYAPHCRAYACHAEAGCARTTHVRGKKVADEDGTVPELRALLLR
jgi:hypothetical protein